MQVLIEKLLYSCSELKEILILVRPKRGKAPESRLEDMFKIPVSSRNGLDDYARERNDLFLLFFAIDFYS